MNKLVTIINQELVSKLSNDPSLTFLYPLKDYCVGYDYTFDIEDINDFVLVNRLLEDSEIDKLSLLLHNSNVKGIVFDDLGIIDVIKDLDITKILLLDHLALNTKSINYYLEYVDSVVVSNDLTEEEIRYIVKESIKPLVVNVFGLKKLMYSRRCLITNYTNYYHLDNRLELKPSIDGKEFIVKENTYGTKFYAYPYYNGLSLLDLDNVLYFWYDPIDLDNDSIYNVVINNKLTNIPTTRLFLDEATTKKVGD